MKRTHLLMLCYLVAIAALFAHTYCERQSLHHFDFKAGLCNNKTMSEWWLARAEWAFLAGLFAVLLAGAFAPFRNKWKNVALEIGTIGAYILISVFV